MNLEEKIAGEISISENPGETMRKWREEFQVAKIDLSRAMDISPSMISDYESGRRKSPGIATSSAIVLTITAIAGDLLTYFPIFYVRLISATLLLYFGIRLFFSARRMGMFII